MLTSPFRSFLVLLTLSTWALSAHAQLVFTATGTAIGTAGGYTNGQSYTFVYTTGSSFANNADSTFNGTANSWSEELTSEDQLFTTIGGTGLHGSFARPVATLGDPFSQLFVGSGNPSFKLMASADSSPSIGLTTLDATPILLAGVNVTGGVNFFDPVGYTQPVDYFSVTNNDLGSYPSATGLILLQGSGFATIENFNITGLAISAIPEPSTYAVLMGLGALGVAIFRRRDVRVG